MLSPRMPDLAALQMLAIVAETGSLSAAAGRLGLSQQGVSARMRTLEAQIGAPLLLRTPRGSTLTATGILVAGWSSEVLAAAGRLDAGIASIRRDTVRQLHVVASQTIAEHLLPLWLVALRRQQESLGLEPTQIKLTASNSEGAIEQVRRGAAAVGFIESPHLPTDLRTAAIRTDRMLLVVGPGHPWARRRAPATAAELAATALVTREKGSGTREALASLFETAGLAPVPPLLELATTAAVRTAVAAGTAPGVLSELVVRDDLMLGRLVAVPLAGLRLERPLTAVWQGGKTPPAGPGRDLVALARRT